MTSRGILPTHQQRRSLLTTSQQCRSVGRIFQRHHLTDQVEMPFQESKMADVCPAQTWKPISKQRELLKLFANMAFTNAYICISSLHVSRLGIFPWQKLTSFWENNKWNLHSQQYKVSHINHTHQPLPKALLNNDTATSKVNNFSFKDPAI